jgi:hypothetical protein
MHVKRTSMFVGLALALTAGAGATAWAASGHASAAGALDAATHRATGHHAKVVLNQHGRVKIGRHFFLTGGFTSSSWAPKGATYTALLYVKGENGKFAPLTGPGAPWHTLTSPVWHGTFKLTVPPSFVRNHPGTETFEVAVLFTHSTRLAAVSNPLLVTFAR